MKKKDKIMDKKNIEKPILLRREEFINNIIQLINESQLPVFIIEYILKDVLKEVYTATQQQYESEKMAYKKQMDELSKEPATNE